MKTAVLKKPRPTRIAAMLGGTALVLAAIGVAASATAGTDDFDPLSVVQAQGVLSGDAAVMQARNLSIQAKEQGSTVESARPLTLTPTNDALGVAEQRSAETTVQTASNFGVVTGLNDQGNHASFIAIKDGAAPRDYSFNIDEASVQAQVQSDGSVMITDSRGQLLNVITTPWAKDALGNNLPTSFTVNGTTITQHVDTTGAVFPVVADPQQGCGAGWCSIYFNKSETKDIGSAGLTALGGAAAACGFGGPPAVFACAAAAASIGATAQYADNHGQCLGLFFTTTPPPFIEWNPFAYDGAQCD
jgi:hypothetical protein